MSSYFFALVFLGATLAGLVFGPDTLHISLKYYDSVLHFLAGIGIGFFVYALSASFAPWASRKTAYFIGALLGVGLVWELYEAFFDIPGYPLWTQEYFFDTAKDLVLDVIGGLIALYTCRHFQK